MSSQYLQMTSASMKSTNTNINTTIKSRIKASLKDEIQFALTEISDYYTGHPPDPAIPPQSMTVSNVSDEDLVNLSFLTNSLDGGSVAITNFTAYTSEAPDTPVTKLLFPSQIFQQANTEAYLAGERSFNPFRNAKIPETVDFITGNNPGLGRTVGKPKIYSFVVNYSG